MFRAITSWVGRIACTVAGAVLVQNAISTSALAFPNVPVPEIDPGSLSSAMTLLVGSALFIMGRRIKK
jgi:hypothetical protein